MPNNIFLPEQTFLVAPCEYDSRKKRLSEQGEKELEAIFAEDSPIRSLGSSALVLSSEMAESRTTGTRIAERLGTVTTTSKRIGIGEANPRAIRDLDMWVLKAIDEEGLAVTDESAIIYVAHKRLLQVARYGTMRATKTSPPMANGQFVRYISGSWDNKDFLSYTVGGTEDALANRIDTGKGWRSANEQPK